MGSKSRAGQRLFSDLGTKSGKRIGRRNCLGVRARHIAYLQLGGSGRASCAHRIGAMHCSGVEGVAFPVLGLVVSVKKGVDVKTRAIMAM